MVEITEEELQKRIADERADAAQRTAFVKDCIQWFTISLSNSKYLSDRGECLMETHNAGISLYNQFVSPPKQPAPKEDSVGDE
jgi:hypothetical protein